MKRKAFWSKKAPAHEKKSARRSSAAFVKRYHPPGTSPGTLPSAAEETAPAKLQLLTFDAHSSNARTLESIEECHPRLEGGMVTWLHVQGIPTLKQLKQLGNLFQLHGLALEDISNIGQRPKLENYDDQLFIILSLPGVIDEELRLDQISLYAGEGFVVSLHAGENDPFEPVRKRLLSRAGTIHSKGSDYLLYALIDTVIDHGFPVLESLGVRIEALEEGVMESPDRNLLCQIHGLKQQMLLMRRMIWPHRELISQLMRDETRLFQPDTLLYLRDCYDHSIQIIELMENYREMISTLQDIYLSSASIRLNEVMRVLTMIATIFIPLTFIAGIYGMNFGNRGDPSPWAMPELDWHYGYPLVLLLMTTIAVAMLIAFKRQKWF